ncbi:regulatory protein RecX [Thiopseudomonas alkaliphila]|uniref:regulatory protein RecX n=1 Tax=Thiopseudomonas alkaliphila TaxID=1697053 RepID=UPI002578A98C|nr:regulatory protein RecX [Thiopseudomonas alkaliphila]MDM1707129.1 regulatory protein RecX [Thiopseudomonas alkaliphila]
MLDEQAVSQARFAAMNLLARREHSAAELGQKLRQREFTQAVIQAVIERLQAQGLQSDERFVESFIRGRAYSGKGPLRLREELQHKGISQELIAEGLANFDGDWSAVLEQVWQKKFGQLPQNQQEKAKQLRFLAYRGFAAAAIFSLFERLAEQA